MNRHLIATASALALSVGIAQAADLGAPRMPIAAAVVAPVFNWTGFYLGTHLGYGWGRTGGSLFTPTGTFQTNEPASPNGVFGGGQLGYNWQFNNIVLGLETDLSAAGFRDSRLYNVNPVFSNNTRINWVGTARARAGLAFDKALLYVTGGLAYGGVSIGAVPGPVGVTSSRTRLGFALGTGVEYAFAPNWTAKLEYMYYNFGSATYTTSVAAEFIRATPQVHTVKIGVNYLFSTGPSAVVARY